MSNVQRAMLAFRMGAFAIVALALAAHMAFTLLLTLPETPISVRLGSVTSHYFYPYFAQNWSFFAPNPPVQDDFVLAQYDVRVPHGHLQTSGWLNLSRTFNESVQRNRTTPLEIVQLSLINAYGDLLRDNTLFHDGRLARGAMSKLAHPAKQPPSLHTLERIAMSYFPRTGIPGQLASVRIALFHHEFPRFSHRADPDDVTKHNSIMIFPAVPAERVAQL